MTTDPNAPNSAPATDTGDRKQETGNREQAAAAAAPAPAPVPDHRDMYLLILGLIVGLVISPWIMGRFMSDVSHEKWYRGGGDKVDAYHEFMKTHRDQQRQKDTELLDRLVATGVTKEAVDEMRAKLAEDARQERLPHEAAVAVEQQARAAWQRGLMMALVVALIVLMLIEPVFEMQGPMAAIRRRLVTARYGVVAVWIAFALGRPHALEGISWGFAALLIAVILAAAALPLALTRVVAEARQ